MSKRPIEIIDENKNVKKSKQEDNEIISKQHPCIFNITNLRFIINRNGKTYSFYSNTYIFIKLWGSEFIKLLCKNDEKIYTIDFTEHLQYIDTDTYIKELDKFISCMEKFVSHSKYLSEFTIYFINYLLIPNKVCLNVFDRYLANSSPNPYGYKILNSMMSNLLKGHEDKIIDNMFKRYQPKKLVGYRARVVVR
jgi:hypothetical protein